MSAGIMLRHGRFSNAENERLRQNVEDFIALTGVKDATKLFHPKMFPEEKWELTKLKKVYRFFERIGESQSNWFYLLLSNLDVDFVFESSMVIILVCRHTVKAFF